MIWGQSLFSDSALGSWTVPTPDSHTFMRCEMSFW